MSGRSILLAGTDQAFEAALNAAFDGTLGRDVHHLEGGVDATDAQQTLSAVLDLSPDVLAIGRNMPLDTAMKVAQMLDVEHPEISVILVADPDPALLGAAMQAGIRDVVGPRADEAQIRSSFERALETAQRRRAALLGTDATPAGPRARIITVLSPKGGSGKTTVSTNVAVNLAVAGAGNVALVDLDLQFGDVSSSLRLLPEHSIADVVHAGQGLDSMGLKLMLTPHSSGLFVLCAPESPAEGEEVSAEVSARAVSLLSEDFPFVVVDTPAGITESALAAVEISTDLIFLCTFDVPSVRGLRKLVQALDQLGMIHQRRHFVLNRADSRVGLSVEDVEATVGMSVDVSLPSSRSVPLSTNQGLPLMEADARSPVSKKLQELSTRFVEQPANTGGGRLFRRSAR